MIEGVQPRVPDIRVCLQVVTGIETRRWGAAFAPPMFAEVPHPIDLRTANISIGVAIIALVETTGFANRSHFVRHCVGSDRVWHRVPRLRLSSGHVVIERIYPNFTYVRVFVQ